MERPDRTPSPAAGGGSSREPPNIGRRGDKLPQVLDYEAIRALGEAAAIGRNALRDKALVWMLYGTGARVSELLSACIGDLMGYFPTLRLKIKGSKGSGERICEIPPHAADTLNAYHAGRGPRAWMTSEPLFTNLQGHRLTRKSAWWILQRARQATGEHRRVFPHALRHSCATHLIEEGAATREVQAYLGHRRVTTTEIYTHVAQGRLTELALRLHPAGRRDR